jgi:ABC-2 type transport system ATP-binding protein
VNLRRDMWRVVRDLRQRGVTIILTTHYIEEAEEMADRIGVINKGEIILVEEKAALMQKLGKKQLTVKLSQPINAIPEALGHYALALSEAGSTLTYTYGKSADDGGVDSMLNDLGRTGLRFTDVQTQESSLEDIFVDLLENGR